MTGTDNNAKSVKTTNLVAWRRIFWTYYILGYSQPQQYQRELGIKDRQYKYYIEFFDTYYNNIKVTGKKDYECCIDLGISGLLKQNPFFNIFLSKTIAPSELCSLFSILLCCKKEEFNSVIRQFTKKGASLSDGPEDDRPLRNKVKQLENNGILIREGRHIPPRCRLSDKTPKNVFLLNDFAPPEDRESWVRHFNSFLDFFSMVGYFGELGFFIKNALNALPCPDRDNTPDPEDDAISFKHAFCAQTLNDEIAWYTLIAIKNRQVVKFTVLKRDEALYTYSDQDKIIVTMLPLKILTSCFKGRRYVFGYIIAEKPYLEQTEMSAPRSGVADSILFDSITAIQLPKPAIPAPDLPKNLYETTIKWGTRTMIRDPAERKNAGPQDSGLIEITFNISINPENAADRDPKLNHSLRRLRRECRNGTVEVTGQTGDTMYAVYRTEAQDEDELQSWVKTYLGRISGLKTRRERFRRIFFRDLHKMLSLYGITGLEEELTGKGDSLYHADDLSTDSSATTESNKGFSTPTSDPGIFSEYYGIFVEITRQILNACRKDTLRYPRKSDIDNIISGTTESLGLKNKFKLHDHYKNEYTQILFPNYAKKGDRREHLNLNPDIGIDHHFIELPLTQAELSWLYTTLKDPLAELFFTAEEYQKIQSKILPFLKEVNKKGNPNTGATELWKPGSLFDRDTRDSPFVIIDAEKEGDPVVTPRNTPEITPQDRQNYIRNFRRLREAIAQRKFVRITHTALNSGKSRTIDLAPLRLEFSLKNAKFRLFTAAESNSPTINLATVSSVEILQACPWDPTIKDTSIFLENQNRDLRFAVVRVTQDRNSIVRFLTEFSYYDKRTCFDEETSTCLVKILYPKEDWRETLIRILGFGATVKLENGATFLKLLKRKGINPEKLDFATGTVTADQDDYKRLLSEIKERLSRQLKIYSADDENLGDTPAG